VDTFAVGLGLLALLAATSLIVNGFAVRRQLKRLAQGAQASAAEAFQHLDTRLAASEAETLRLRQRLSELEGRVSDDDRRMVEEIASLSRIARAAG
jgi:ABC-type phosphate transport system auxiliary subunit